MIALRNTMAITSAPLQPSAASSALRLSTRGTATCRVSFPKIFTVLYYNDRTGSAVSKPCKNPTLNAPGVPPPPGPWRNFRSERVVRNRPGFRNERSTVVPAGRSDRSESADFFLIFSTDMAVGRTRVGPCIVPIETPRRMGGVEFV